MNKNKKIFSFDAETDGLWGYPFAIAAIVYDADGSEIDKIALRMPDYVVKDEWVRENVLPAMEDMDVSHASYSQMINDFSKFYLAHKDEADVICHMGYIVEAFLLREMQDHGAIETFEGPYPLIDIAGNLQQVGENPTSVDDYIKKHNLVVSDYGSTHNPLYDCEAAARVYMHLLKK